MLRLARGFGRGNARDTADQARGRNSLLSPKGPKGGSEVAHQTAAVGGYVWRALRRRTRFRNGIAESHDRSARRSFCSFGGWQQTGVRGIERPHPSECIDADASLLRGEDAGPGREGRNPSYEMGYVAGAFRGKEGGRDSAFRAESLQRLRKARRPPPRGGDRGAASLPE